MANLAIVKGNSESTINPRWCEDLRGEVRRVCSALDQSYFDVGRVLYELETRRTENGNHAWQIWGWASFGEAVEKEFGVERDRARRLVRVYERLHIKMETLDPLLRKRIVALGFSKVSILVRVLTLKNAAEWVVFAEKASFVDLHNRVQEAAKQVVSEANVKAAQAKQEKKAVSEDTFDPDSDEAQEAADLRRAAQGVTVDPESAGPAVPEDNTKERLIVRKLTFTESSWDMIRQALDRQRQVSRSDNDGYNFSLICLQFLADAHYGKAGDYQKAIHTYLSHLESNLGLKLVAIDPKQKEFVYGRAALESLARSGETEEEDSLVEEESSDDAQEGVYDAQEDV